MNKELFSYFKRKIYNSSVGIIVGKYPDFQSKENIDRWIEQLETKIKYGNRK